MARSREAATAPDERSQATTVSEPRPRIVYLQYTNPAGYPPLEHSSRILVDSGWDVLFLGAASDGTDSLAFPPHPAMMVRRFPSYGHGMAERLNYLAFIGWVVTQCLAYRPTWIYASDPLSCPAALAVRAAITCGTVYHEHDSPDCVEHRSRLQRVLRAARLKIAHRAELCLLPQAQRVEAFVESTGRRGPTLCIWNCPTRNEVRPARTHSTRSPLTFHYHGSLNVERLPFTVLDALATASDTAQLTIVGYETIGSRGYVRELLGKAEALGVGGRVRFLGPLPRRDVLEAARDADVGLAFMPPATNDLNMTHMTGASNKPFDYLAVGQMLLVSDLSNWRAMFIEPGYALACDPYSAGSLARVMRWCVENAETVRVMGEARRQRILAEWNYETCFAPVVERLRGGIPSAHRIN
jgi:glycosyltransferase involved in cell wall biosynthesis